MVGRQWGWTWERHTQQVNTEAIILSSFFMTNKVKTEISGYNDVRRQKLRNETYHCSPICLIHQWCTSEHFSNINSLKGHSLIRPISIESEKWMHKILHQWPLTWSAAGSRPTADISEVLPPTQSNIGNLANQPSILAVLSNNEFSCVMATPWREIHKSSMFMTSQQKEKCKTCTKTRGKPFTPHQARNPVKNLNIHVITNSIQLKVESSGRF